jgi:hypothetical protein
MLQEISDLISDIAAHDRLMGFAALQMNQCAEDERWFPALASLFPLTEQALRWASNAKDETRLEKVIESAREQKIVSYDESEVLDSLRKYRNVYMHTNFHGVAFSIEGLYYWTGEAETAEELYRAFALPCMKIVYKLLTTKPSGGT